MHKTVEVLAVNGHLIETVEIDKNTLGLCVGVEYSEGMPVFVDNGLKINGGKNPTVLVVKEKQDSFKLYGEGAPINAVKHLQKIVKEGGSFTVIGNVYDNAELIKRKTA